MGIHYQSCFLHRSFNWVGSRKNHHQPKLVSVARKVTLVRKSKCVLFCSRLGKCALIGRKVHFQSEMDGLFSIEFRAVDMVQIGHMIFKIAVFY